MAGMLSAIILARDEAANIAGAIDSVREVVDEVVVGDTGSTDDTVIIAREHGARVVSIPWRSRFDEALNTLTDASSGDTVFRLDADERLVPEAAKALRRHANTASLVAGAVVRRDIFDSARPEESTEMWQVRLYRRVHGLRWHGRLHADLVTPTGTSPLVTRCEDVALLHFGLARDLAGGKLRRNVELLWAAVGDEPSDLNHLVELGRTLFVLKDPAAEEVLCRAARIVNGRAESLHPPATIVCTLLEFLLTLPNHPAARELLPERAEKLAIRWFADYPPLVWLRAQRRYQAGDVEGSLTLLEHVRQLARTCGYDRANSFDPRILGVDLAINLAACYAALGRVDEASAALTPFVDDPVRRDTVRRSLAALTKAAGGVG